MADKKSDVGPAVAGVAGALVGAAVGAAAIALSDKKTRKQVLSKLNELKSQAGGQFHELKADLQKWVEENAGDMINSATGNKALPKGKKPKSTKAKKSA